MVRATSSNNKPKQGLIEYLRDITSRNKARKSEQHGVLEQRFAHMDALSEQLTNKQAEANEVAQRVASLGSELRDARNAFEGYRVRVSQEESGISGMRGANSKSLLDAAETELNRVIAELETQEERLSSLRSEIESLRNEKDSSHGATLADVKAYQSTLIEQRTLVTHLEELVRNAEARSVPDCIDAEELNAFRQAREELLADIAAGIAKPEELEALDAEAESFLNESAGRQEEAQNAARNHQQTLAGLTRRLAAAQERYAELAGRMPQVIEQLLITRAADTYEQYKAASEALMTSYRQLQGLQEVLTVTVPQSKVRLLSPRWPSLFIPSAGGVLVPGQDSDCIHSGQTACQAAALQIAHKHALIKLADEGLSELFERDSNA